MPRFTTLAAAMLIGSALLAACSSASTIGAPASSPVHEPPGFR